MGFTVKDRLLKKCLQLSKRYEQQVCARCFLTIHRQLNIDKIKCLNKKIDMTGSIQPFD